MILCVCPNPSIDTYAWLDNFHLGESNRIKKIESFAGGKGIHVALALQELNAPLKLMGIWAGKNGHWLKDECSKRGIEVSGIDINGSNRTCYTFRSDNETLNHTELLEPGPECSRSDWQRFMSVFEDSIQTADLVCISGSLPKGAPDRAYLEMVEVCNKHLKKVIVDCAGIQLLHLTKTNLYGLHINESEFKDLQVKMSDIHLIDQLKKNIKLLAITKGKEGLELITPKARIKANVLLDDVVSTVGSGDCLTAGLALATYKSMTHEETAQLATACGAANCLTEDLGQLTAEHVEILLPQIQLNTLNEVC